MGLNKYVVLALFLVLCSAKTEANWLSPVEVVNGGWGTGVSEFGFSSNATRDMFPFNYYLIGDNKILIEDIFQNNGRMKIYENGQLQKITKCNKTDSGSWNDECNILGDYVSIDQNGNIWTVNKGEYRLTRPTGELIESVDKKPVELGSIRKENINGRLVEVINYNDIIFYLSGTGSFDEYFRDLNDYLYITTIHKKKAPASSDPASVYTVEKFDQCGRVIGSIELPISRYGVPMEWLNAPGGGSIAIEEYGPPVIGPDGSIYCWKRTPDTYSILKWEWVDDPSDPKPGPDTPDNFQVIPANQGIYVTWDLSPQDPGCVDTYEIERATSFDGIYSTIATVDKGEKSYNDTGVVQGQDYYYRLRAVADDLYSDFTAAMSGKLQ